MSVDTEVLTRHGHVDTARVEQIYRELLFALGEDPDRDGLRDTPRRVAATWKEFLDYDPGRTDSVFTHDSAGTSAYVVVRGIAAWTLCEHHLLPFRLLVAVGYVPTEGVVLGLSKVARIVQAHAHRLQIQERFTAGVAADIATRSGSPDVGVWAEGEHLCMSMRGAHAREARTATTTLLGRVQSDPVVHGRLAAAAGIGTGTQ